MGGFPEDVIGSEDAYVAARMLLGGYAVRYATTAEVYHSHDYSVLEEFRRYFDIGVFTDVSAGSGRRSVRPVAKACVM